MQACSVVCSLQNTCHGEGSPGGRPPRPWKIAQLLSTHKHWPLNQSLHRHYQARMWLPAHTHRNRKLNAVAVHCTVAGNWQEYTYRSNLSPANAEIFFFRKCMNARIDVPLRRHLLRRRCELVSERSSCCCRSSFAGKNRSSEWSPTTPVPHLLDPRE